MKTSLQDKMLLMVGFTFLVGCALWFMLPSSNRPRKPLYSKQEFIKKFVLQERVLKSAQGTDKRFYALGQAAKLALEAGEFGKAKSYATQYLQMSPGYKFNWNYGNAIHDSHMVLGRVALIKGDKKTAIDHLLASGKTPGSPQLGSFGPNMSLAKDLVAKGEKKSVIAYFDECKMFWKDPQGHLNTWKQEVAEGKMPDFGANLVY